VSTPGYDVIAAEVHRKALENLTNEMAIAMMRTSGSPVVTEAKDFSACFMDTVPEHLGFAAYVINHIGSSIVGTRAIAARAAGEELRPGDGFLVNDPHDGGAVHQGDVAVIMPTFHGDRHLGWSFVNMHVLDTGGVGVSGYAPGAYDVYQEGLLFPPVKIIRDGAIDGEWERFIAANVRAPHEVLNDIRSMIAGCNVAAGKLSEIVDEFGVERHVEYCRINKDLTERVLRERIERIPDGVYETVDWNEFDGHDGPELLLEMGVRLEVRGSDLRFAFRGVPQVDAFVNSAPGAMLGQTMTALLTMLAYGDLPVNGGFLRPVHVDLGPFGTIVNSRPPAPVSNAHSEVGQRSLKMVQEVMNQALSLSPDPVLRGRVHGQPQDGFPGVNLFGANQHGGSSVIFYTDNAVGAGGGAQTIADGQDSYGMTQMTGCGIPEIEGHEAADPVLFLWREIIPNSGGPGQRRGGQGFEQAFALVSSDRMYGPGFNAVAQVPPRGTGGGMPAATGDFRPIRGSNVQALLDAGRLPRRDVLEGEAEQVRSKITRLLIERDDVLVVRSGGGAGLGDPLLRDPGLVAADVRDGYVTGEHARVAYGVVLTADGEVDEAATVRERREIRRARIGEEPVRDAVAPASQGVALELGDADADGRRAWCCAACGEAVGEPGGNWRDGAALREARAVDRYEQLGMFVRPRAHDPEVMVREYACRACASALGVDVAVAGHPRLAAAQVSGETARSAPV